MARIAIKVDVDTLRGTREGLPRLLRSLDRAGAPATLLFSLGPDHTGWALRRVFRRGFLTKVSRTSVLSHYGLKTVLYGVLLPAPDIGRVAAATLRSALGAGFEGGIHCWDHVLWQDNVRYRPADWTLSQMGLAHARYLDLFGAPPATHGAAGWQTNAAALTQIDAWGMTHASDGRGSGPWLPMVEGRPLRHVQLPTTLPTFDELLGVDGLDETTVATRILGLTESDRNQVFTAHAELEGGALAPAFATLLAGWRAQGHSMVTLAGLRETVDPARLPRAELNWGSVAGRSGELVVG